jgi:hypothetical protein
MGYKYHEIVVIINHPLETVDNENESYSTLLINDDVIAQVCKDIKLSLYIFICTNHLSDGSKASSIYTDTNTNLNTNTNSITSANSNTNPNTNTSTSSHTSCNTKLNTPRVSKQESLQYINLIYSKI